MIRNVKRTIAQQGGIVVGAMLMAISYSWFLVPYKITPGGIGGLAQIFFHLFGLPTGISMLIMNVPLFIFNFLFMGKQFGIRTLIGMVLVSLFTDLLSIQSLHNLGIIGDIANYTFELDGKSIVAMLSPDDIYLTAIAGSVLLGAGLGIVFRFRGSTGGTDIPVAYIKEKLGVSIGTGYWMVETLIILTVGIVFGDLKIIIWGYVNLFISSKLTDITSEGLPYVKGVYVISHHTNEIKEELFNRIHRGVTFFKAEGGYSGNQFNVLFCAMNRRQVAIARDIIRDIDPDAFVLLTDVHDVMGYGFKSRQLELSSD